MSRKSSMEYREYSTIMSDESPLPSFSRVRLLDRTIRPLGGSTNQTNETNDPSPPNRRLPGSRYYFTSGHDHLGKSAKNVTEEELFFVVPKNRFVAYSHLCKARRAEKTRDVRKKNIFDTFNDPTSSSDILRRLRVDVPLEIEESKVHKQLDKANAITDVEPNYFTELRERVVKDRFNVRDYVDDARKVLRIRLLAGQERDDCVRIDAQFEEERTRLEEIKRKYRRYVVGFEDFLSKDHRESMEILGKADKTTNATVIVGEQFEDLEKEIGRVGRELYVLEENRRTVETCREFLRQLAPRSSRARRVSEMIEIQRIGEMTSTSIENSNDLLFRNYDSTTTTTTTSTSLETLIENFERDVTEEELSLDSTTENIYFEDPYEMLRIFRSMELQNLNALVHCESLAAPVNAIAANVIETNSRIREEIEEIDENTNELQVRIVREEERARSLENQADRLLRGVFRELACSEESLHLFVHVEDAYESCLAPNEANLDAYAMIRAIERLYEDLNAELDQLPISLVDRCEERCFREERTTTREAERAARKLQSMRRLLAALERVIAVPAKTTREGRKNPKMTRTRTRTRRGSIRVANESRATLPTRDQFDPLELFTEPSFDDLENTSKS